jgi:phosphatidylglycerol:prolipoprotein diacylglycerol transferase
MQVSAMFLMGYGLARSVCELAREPDAFLGFLTFGMTMGQWLSLPMIVAGAALFGWSRRSARPR